MYGREGTSQNTVNASNNMEYSSEVWPEVSFKEISDVNRKAFNTFLKLLHLYQKFQT